MARPLLATVNDVGCSNIANDFIWITEREARAILADLEYLDVREGALMPAVIEKIKGRLPKKSEEQP